MIRAKTYGAKGGDELSFGLRNVLLDNVLEEEENLINIALLCICRTSIVEAKSFVREAFAH